MGLDSIEILMRVEDTFSIKIPDQEAQQIITVGDFHNVVWRHLSGKHTERCQSQHLFYKLRTSFAETFDISPKKLSVNTPPEEIFPVTNRRQVYLNFSETIGLKLPELALERFWSTLLTSFGVATVIGGLITSLILIYLLNYSYWMFLIPVGGIVLTFVFSEVLNPKRTTIRAITMRDFTEHTLALNYSSLANSNGVNRQEMEVVINHIIADMAGLDLEEVASDKKISDDLGID